MCCCINFTERLWCDQHGFSASLLLSDVCALFVQELSSRRWHRPFESQCSLLRRRTSISVSHQTRMQTKMCRYSKQIIILKWFSFGVCGVFEAQNGFKITKGLPVFLHASAVVWFSAVVLWKRRKAMTVTSFGSKRSGVLPQRLLP